MFIYEANKEWDFLLLLCYYQNIKDTGFKSFIYLLNLIFQLIYIEMQFF